MERFLTWPSEEGLPSSRPEIKAWWEARRLRFNSYVGIVGLVTWLLVVFAGSAAVKDGIDFEEPVMMLFGPLVYGLFANLCYTFGWIYDTTFYQGKPRTKLYKAGVIFSVTLTALPGIWAIAAWLMTVITGRKLD